jgi:ankyrin repeat protein
MALKPSLRLRLDSRINPILFFVLVLPNLYQADGNAAAELLGKASRLGDVKTLDSLLSSGINPELLDHFGHTPLYYAVSFNQTNAVELLLNYHADPNALFKGHIDAPQTSATPLQIAAELGNRRIASLLIAAGAEVDEKGPTGRTALHYARGQLDVVQLLINKGADVNARDADGISPLNEAAWTGSIDTAAILLLHGAHINEIESKTGLTPINEASYQGHSKLVQYLLQFKPDLGIADKKGYGPLDNAIRMGKEDCAVLLLDAEPGLETPQFLAAAMDAAVRKDESVVVDRLLERGATADAALPSGATPLDAAAFGGASKAVDVLLRHYANPNVSGPNGNSPLEDASLKGFEPIVATLLEHGANVNRINIGSGTTALYSAASFGKGRIVDLLLNHGAKPNLCGKNRKTAYQAAIENGFKDIALQIQKQGGSKSCEP